MDFLVGFFSSDYAKVVTGIIAVFAFAISLYNFFRLIIMNHPSFLVTVREITQPMNHAQQVFIDVVNKSGNNIIILDITIVTNCAEYKAERHSELYKTVRKNGKETDYYTLQLPVVVRSQDYITGCFEFLLNDRQPIPLSNVTIKLSTSKGVVRKRINLEGYSQYIH